MGLTIKLLISCLLLWQKSLWNSWVSLHTLSERWGEKKPRVKMCPGILVTLCKVTAEDILRLQPLMITLFCKDDINVKFTRKHHLKSGGLTQITDPFSGPVRWTGPGHIAAITFSRLGWVLQTFLMSVGQKHKILALYVLKSRKISNKVLHLILGAWIIPSKSFSYMLLQSF